MAVYNRIRFEFLKALDTAGGGGITPFLAVIIHTAFWEQLFVGGFVV
jgi:hypothetical protein